MLGDPATYRQRQPASAASAASGIAVPQPRGLAAAPRLQPPRLPPRRPRHHRARRRVAGPALRRRGHAQRRSPRPATRGTPVDAGTERWPSRRMRAPRRPHRRRRPVGHRRRPPPPDRLPVGHLRRSSRHATPSAAPGTSSATPASARTRTCTRWATRSGRGPASRHRRRRLDPAVHPRHRGRGGHRPTHPLPPPHHRAPSGPRTTPAGPSPPSAATPARPSAHLRVPVLVHRLLPLRPRLPARLRRHRPLRRHRSCTRSSGPRTSTSPTSGSS